VQIDRARRLVPAARFLRADVTEVRLPPASFEAVVCLYALIHLPLAEQPPLLDRIATWLRSRTHERPHPLLGATSQGS
jgi:hypothetical protein